MLDVASDQATLTYCIQYQQQLVSVRARMLDIHIHTQHVYIMGICICTHARTFKGNRDYVFQNKYQHKLVIIII